ncbi:MAG: hypothetical protein ACN6OJ_21740 [Chryseobacterium sp.]|uniref:hypothetical protein n=1 Tax=Chryseobacterium sp. TaxID=1871047 RepID=UPI003D1087C2
MSDINIIDEELAWMIVAGLLSAAVFFLIFLYHVIVAHIESNKEKIKFKDTRSYGYIIGGGAVMGFEFFCLLLLLIKNNSVQEIVTLLFTVVLFLSPVMIGLIGFYYNRSKKL